jgi:hypothetical protein
MFYYDFNDLIIQAIPLALHILKQEYDRWLLNRNAKDNTDAKRKEKKKPPK